MIFSTKPNRSETIYGSVYLLIQFLFLPSVLAVINALLPSPLTSGKLNFLYFSLNFVAIVVIFRRFLLQSLRDGLKRFVPTLWYAALGYLGYRALGQILMLFILRVYPGFANVNDQSVIQTLRSDYILMAVGTIALVPVAEETLFRGLIFRGLYDRSPAAAYIISMVSFAAIHVMSYAGSYDFTLLLLCFLQYLPAGYALCFAYHRSGSICAPILMHAFINAVSVYAMR